jgi:hypothetical protein
LIYLCLRGLEGCLALVEFLVAGHFGGEQFLVTVKLLLGEIERGFALGQGGGVGAQQGHLVVHVFDGVLELVTSAASLGHLPAHGGLRGDEVGLGRFQGCLLDGDLHAVRLLVEHNEDVSFVDAVIVIDEDLRDLPGNARGDEGDVAVHISVVGGFGVEGREGHLRHDHENDDGDRDQSDPAERAPRLGC